MCKQKICNQMSANKRKTFLSIATKQEIIKELSNGVGATVLSKKFGVAKSTISGIKKNKSKIESVLCLSKSALNKKSFRKAEYPRVEKALYNWFLRQRAKNLPVSGEMLKVKAKKLHGLLENAGGFNASAGWLQGFKARYGVRLLKICGEKLSSDAAAVDPFKNKLSAMIREHGFCEEQIYNADESGLFWKMLPEKTYVCNHEKTAPGRKIQKARITFLACTNATGLHKLKPLVIGHAKKPRSFKGFDIPAEYRSSKNAWMTASIFKEWFHTSFVHQVKSNLQQKGLPLKAVLLLDNAPCHPPEQELVTEDGSIFVLYMPPNVTPLIQPMDQNVIRITKLNYKKHLLQRAIRKENINEFFKELTLKDGISILMLAWHELASDMIKKCWSSLLGGCRNEEDSDEDEENMPLNLLQRSMRQHREEELNPILDMLQTVNPNEVFTTDDIREWDNAENLIPISAEGDSNPHSESETDDIEEISGAKSNISATQAVQIFDKAIAWAEDNTSNYEYMLVLHKFRDLAVQKAKNACTKQKTLTDFFVSL